MNIKQHRYNNPIPNPTLSIIIVAYKTGEELANCLESLRKQRNQNFEILLIDNDSEDRSIFEHHSLRYYKLGRNFGPSHARNYGASRARAEIVAFLDDDAVADELWVSSILSAFQDESIVAIRGRIKLKSKSTYFNVLPAVYDLGDAIIESPLSTEGNSAVRKTQFLQAGGFDTTLYGQEGLDLSYRLNPLGKQLYAPDVVISHDAGDNLNHLLRREFRAGYNGTLLTTSRSEVSKYGKSIKTVNAELKRTKTLRQKIQRSVYKKLSSIAYHGGSITFRFRVGVLKGNTSLHIKQ